LSFVYLAVTGKRRPAKKWPRQQKKIAEN